MSEYHASNSRGSHAHYQCTPRRMCANATLSLVGSSTRGPAPRAAFESGNIL